MKNDDLIYIGDDKGIIRIFSNKGLQIGILNYKAEELDYIINNNENEKVSVTSIDILSSKNLLVYGFYNGVNEI